MNLDPGTLHLAATAEETVDIPPFDLRAFMAEHWWEWALIFVLTAFIYNRVFRVRKLPLLKDALIYVLIALGSFVLLILQIDANLPIILCLLVAVALMAVVRIRRLIQDRRGNAKPSTDAGAERDAASGASTAVRPRSATDRPEQDRKS
jgi:hypothetical protein